MASAASAGAAPPAAPNVALLVTCLVDAIRPNIGFATIKALEEAGCRVAVPEAQTCCGQPALNSGDAEDARAVARDVIRAFEGYDHVVIPSGSCAGTLRHYPELFADELDWRARAEALAAKTHEILSFLHDVMGYEPKGVRFARTATYHDTCSGLRELGVFKQPRLLLRHVEGLNMVPLEGNNACCGFGGTFCVKYPDISNSITADKARQIDKTGAEVLLAGDLGCLMNMAGKLKREGSTVKVYHTVEVLAGMADGPAVAEGEA